MGDLRKMLQPQTIALIGASAEPSSIGKMILENLLLSNRHMTFPVNPRFSSLLDVPCHSTIMAVPQKVDLAVIATPAESVPAIVEECGKAQVEGIIIISAGFKETGPEGRGLEEEVSEIRKKYGMRIMGPNCVGLIRPAIGLNTTFFKTMPEPGKIAFISQSGALGSAIFDWAMANGIGFSLFASIGSMIDVDFGDLIDYLGDDYGTRSIIVYMETMGNVRKFMSAARGFAHNKPIVVLKPGRFSEGAKAILSHTGSDAGNDAVYDVAFKRVGVVRVEEIRDLFSTAAVLDSRNLPGGPNLAIITNAGGPGVMTTDRLIEMGGRPADLSEKSIAELNSFLPPFWSRGNPIDLLGDADEERYVKATTICLNDQQVDGILIIYTPQDLSRSTGLARVITEHVRKAWKPVITVWMGERLVQEGRDIFIGNDIPTMALPKRRSRLTSTCTVTREI